MILLVWAKQQCKPNIRTANCNNWKICNKWCLLTSDHLYINVLWNPSLKWTLFWATKIYHAKMQISTCKHDSCLTVTHRYIFRLTHRSSGNFKILQVCLKFCRGHGINICPVSKEIFYVFGLKWSANAILRQVLSANTKGVTPWDLVLLLSSQFLDSLM